ncbi:hypothetical protein AAFC00_006432 [Neodothiora populina]|uniref:Uncharacterized protein n=1 Tax=Neodothiora populina TaxID=2781224 RepID=A0ABR3P5H6_9PEZI
MADALQNVDKKVLSALGLKDGIKATKAEVQRQTPICDRCHDLIHHSGSTSTPILHPSIESIQSIIEDSPHKENHIYHIIDAADFPMSVIPNLTSALRLPRLRTQNRRSKDKRFLKGRVAEVSFIITRSDLLAPQKEQVDGLMPYLRETLREALGKTGEKARLGNVRCVSSKRGWWTKTVKEDVWDRGGAGWMVGKVNVGKSGFFEAVFPKGRGGEALSIDELRRKERLEQFTPAPSTSGHSADFPGEINTDMGTTIEGKETEIARTEEEDALLDEDEDFDSVSLLPPARNETQYPVMPIISSLPGTTASPIRIPFGSGRGELIDLPGIARSNLEEYVKPEHRDTLVMKNRITPEQHVIKPGQSLLLGGGLIRITPPKEQELVVLAYPFVPLQPHVTATAKAEGIETGEREMKTTGGIDRIVADGVLGQADTKIKSAGTFKLQWDVTRKRVGPLTDPSAAKLRPEKLAFKVYGADVLIEGVGWVELVAQVRKKTQTSAIEEETDSIQQDEQKDDSISRNKPYDTQSSTETEPASPPRISIFKPLLSPSSIEDQNDQVPKIEVFSPEGKFVAVRPPMNAWLLNAKREKAGASTTRGKSRPRVSMRSVKGSKEGRRRMGQS